MRDAGRRGCVLLIVAAVIFVAGCNTKWRSVQQHKPSDIQVNASAAAVMVRTPAATFELARGGYLKASLQSGEKQLSLDEATGSSGYLVSGGKRIDDFVLGLANAQTSNAPARLGDRGKKIEVT